MVLTTTGFEENRVKEVKGLVFGEIVLGNSAAKDMKASWKALTGGRAFGYEQGLKEAREAAVCEMAAEAEKLEADAIVGISVDYELLGEGSMVVVTASGTAVTLK